MKNKMINDIEPENDQEREIAKVLQVLRESEEVQKFSKKMENIAEKNEVMRYRFRIKNTNSAIRTFRIRKMAGASEANDYCGYTLITEDETNIPKIVSEIKEILPDGECINLIDERNVYLPIFKIKKCPPLSYIIFARKQTKENTIWPIEIRVCTKEGYISEQAVYFTIYKNDRMNITLDEQDKIRDVYQYITYKLALLDTRKDLSKEERNRHIIELEKILETDDCKNYIDTFESVIAEYGRLVYEFENYNTILKAEESLTEEQKDDIIENIRAEYLEIFKSNKDLKFIDRINLATEEFRKKEYISFLKKN